MSVATEHQIAHRDDQLCVIWSNEHRAWWRPARRGYTLHLNAAGRYDLADAISICASARDGWLPGEPPPEIPVRLVDALACERKAAGLSLIAERSA